MYDLFGHQQLPRRWNSGSYNYLMTHRDCYAQLRNTSPEDSQTWWAVLASTLVAPLRVSTSRFSLGNSSKLMKSAVARCGGNAHHDTQDGSAGLETRPSVCDSPMLTADTSSSDIPEADSTAAHSVPTLCASSSKRPAWLQDRGPIRNPMDIFLSKRFTDMNVFRNPTNDLVLDNAAAEGSGLSWHLPTVDPVRVQRFLTEGCLVRSGVMGCGGGVLGLLFGAFFFTMRPVDVDTAAPFLKQVREQYRNFIPEVTRTAKSFAKLGAVYTLAECFVERERASHDIMNAIYAGCVTGAFLAAKNGPASMAAGCAGFAAFSAVMEKVQPFASLSE
eukprot:GHVT01081597.1.p1 GENE.GHVT01081597.1~~GHVT01081597.1.p1  ORF type:complete len:332 (-),score=16.19 GHVT01081597.1:1212-2207(-)